MHPKVSKSKKVSPAKKWLAPFRAPRPWGSAHERRARNRHQGSAPKADRPSSTPHRETQLLSFRSFQFNGYLDGAPQGRRDHKTAPAWVSARIAGRPGRQDVSARPGRRHFRQGAYLSVPPAPCGRARSFGLPLGPGLPGLAAGGPGRLSRLRCGTRLLRRPSRGYRAPSQTGSQRPPGARRAVRPSGDGSP